MHILPDLWPNLVLDFLPSWFPWYFPASREGIVLPWLWCSFSCLHRFFLPSVFSIPWAFLQSLLSQHSASQNHISCHDCGDGLCWADFLGALSSPLFLLHSLPTFLTSPGQFLFVFISLCYISSFLCLRTSLYVLIISFHSGLKPQKPQT